MIQFVLDGKVNKNSIKPILDFALKNSKLPIEDIIKNNNFFVEQKEISLQEVINEVLKENSNLEKEFEINYNRASKFLMGQVMKKTGGRAKIDELNNLIKALYEEKK
ncbi:aspartyl/glutamyl-tRNA amidotransferase subunit B [Chlamydia trachomatis]|nr:aspartyl/glutamyl-tRNA amidotransferase subunit B [Chlamydia trachomatis]